MKQQCPFCQFHTMQLVRDLVGQYFKCPRCHKKVFQVLMYNPDGGELKYDVGHQQ